jgi:hypothetical protein
MTTEEQKLRDLFHNAVVPADEPPDRVAAVGARVRRSRLAATGLAAAAVGIGLMIAVPAVSSRQESAAIPPASTDTAPVVSASTAGCARPPMTDPDLDALSSQLRQTAEADFASSFSNLEITDRIRVFRKPDSAFDAWVKGTFARECVELLDVAHSARENRELIDRIESDRGYWTEKGISINTLSVSATGTLQLGISGGDLAEVETTMHDRYQRPVRVTEEGAVPPAGGPPD